MNSITLIGNLTRDPETRTTTSNMNTCVFTIAVNRMDKQTDFFRITVWGNQVEPCATYLKKGSKVAVIGEFRMNTYKNASGETRYSLDVNADHVEFLTKGERA